MKAAVVQDFKVPPRYADFADPLPQDGEVVVEVRAAALNQLARSQASGAHYSSGGKLPFVAGNDGVGLLPDGRRVYFAQPREPFGSMAEKSVVRRKLCIPLPEAVDTVTAAAIANPAMSSWAALTARTKLAAGEGVLINGATGAAGRLAIRIAKHLGAKNVVATGRRASGLEELRSWGADATVPLDQPQEDLEKAFARIFEEGRVDIVLDYLWGSSAESLVKTFAGWGYRHGGSRLRFIQLGSLSGPAISLPAAALRSSGLEIMGSGFGSVTVDALIQSIGEMFQVAAPARLEIETEKAPLEDVESAWNRDTGGRRLVFVL